MAHFDDIVMPDNIRFRSTGSPVDGTKRIILPSGVDKVNAIWDQKLRLLEQSWRVDQADAAELLEIWEVCSTVHSFRVRDWRDWNTGPNQQDGGELEITAFDMPLQNTTDQTFVGDGSTVLFQAIRRYQKGSLQLNRIIKKLEANPLAAVNGVPLTEGPDYTVNLNTGAFDFTGFGAPPNGQTVQAGFLFHIPGKILNDDGFTQTLLEGGVVEIANVLIQEVRL